MEQNSMEKRCKCPHHMMVPVLLILLGLAFLLKAAGVLSEGLVSYLWPLLLILIGLQKIMGKVCRCCCGKC